MKRIAYDVNLKCVNPVDLSWLCPFWQISIFPAGEFSSDLRHHIALRETFSLSAAVDRDARGVGTIRRNEDSSRVPTCARTGFGFTAARSGTRVSGADRGASVLDTHAGTHRTTCHPEDRHPGGSKALAKASSIPGCASFPGQDQPATRTG